MDIPATRDRIQTRIAECLQRLGEPEKLGTQKRKDIVDEARSFAIAILRDLYYADCEEIRILMEADKVTAPRMGRRYAGELTQYAQAVKGMLEYLSRSLEDGLLESIVTRVSGERLSFMVGLAQEALNEGSKEVAGVLVAAAFEDAIKCYGEAHGLPKVRRKDLTEALHMLSSSRVISEAQFKTMSNHGDFRDRALHANWDQIDEASTRSLIAYLESFISKQLGGSVA